MAAHRPSYAARAVGVAVVVLVALLPLLGVTVPAAQAIPLLPARCAADPPSGPGNGNSNNYDNAAGYHRQTAWSHLRDQKSCAFQGGWYTTSWDPHLVSTFVPGAVTLTADKTTFSTVGAPPYSTDPRFVIAGSVTLTFAGGGDQTACPVPSYCGQATPMPNWQAPQELESNYEAVGIGGSTGCGVYPAPASCTYPVLANKDQIASGGADTVYVGIPWGYDPLVNRNGNPNDDQQVDDGNVAAIAIQVTGEPVSQSIVVNATGDQPLSPGAQADHVCAVANSASTCTLRAAIQLVNTLTGSQSIHFAIPGGTTTIAPTAALPVVSTPVTIDGTTQPGGWVVLSGAAAGAGNGLEVDGAASTVRGLVVNGFGAGAGIVAGGSSGAQVIVGNRVGTDAAGSSAVANLVGILLQAPNVTVGGTAGTTAGACTGDCNLVSGNTHVQVANCDDDAVARCGGPYGSVRVQGNWIGVDSTGKSALPGTRGILIGPGSSSPAYRVLIGGVSAAPGRAPGNVVAADYAGIQVGTQDGDEPSGAVVIAGNLVGEDVTGTRAVGHGEFGILSLDRPQATTIGGETDGSANVVGGWNQGLVVNQGSVIGNRVGTNAAGTAAVFNNVGVAGGTLQDNLVSGNNVGVAGIDARLTHGNVIGLDASGARALPNNIGIGVLPGAEETSGSPDSYQVAHVGVDATSGTPVCTTSPCNVISGNALAGIKLGGAHAALDMAGSYVGTDRTGTHAVPNGVGVDITTGDLTAQHVGGGSGASSGRGCRYPCNVIAGNSGFGVSITAVAGGSPGSVAGWLAGNYLGVDADGATLADGGAAASIGGVAEAGTLTVGGDIERGNFLSTSFSPGASAPALQVTGTTSVYPAVTASSNRYHVTRPAGAIARPAGTVNPPVLAAAAVSGTSVTVTGSTHVAADSLEAPEQIEVYAVSSCDVAGTYAPIATGTAAKLSGDFSIDVPAGALAGRTGIYAVRTDQAHSTSAFSRCLAGPRVTASTTALRPGQHELEVASDAGWKPGAYAQVDIAGHPTTREVSQLGSLIFAAPLSRIVKAGTAVVRVAAPKNDTKAPKVTVLGLPSRAVVTGSRLVVRFRCADGHGVGVERCPTRLRLPTGKVGRHVRSVQAWDRNGNLRAVKVVWRVTRS